jgi:hypothetical protein
MDIKIRRTDIPGKLQVFEKSFPGFGLQWVDLPRCMDGQAYVVLKGDIFDITPRLSIKGTFLPTLT